MSGAYDCFYVLDAADCILDWGGPRWSAFASANGGGELARSRPRGESIYEHVAGHFTQRFLREFFSAARAAAAPLRRHYRCDSPRMKRLMEMSAGAESGGRLRVEHRLVAETPMPVEVDCRETPKAGRAEYQRCSICNRLRRHGEEGWREPEKAAAGGPLSVIHTVCADCRDGIGAHPPLQPLSLS